MLDYRTRIGSIVDGISGRISQQLRLLTQQAREDRVEGTHPQITRRIVPYQLADTPFHLTSSLVGKSESQNMPRRYSLLQKISDLIG